MPEVPEEGNMDEVYAIGVTLALENGLSAGLEAARHDLASLDRAIAATATGFSRLSFDPPSAVPRAGPAPVPAPASTPQPAPVDVEHAGAVSKAAPEGSSSSISAVSLAPAPIPAAVPATKGTLATPPPALPAAPPPRTATHHEERALPRSPQTAPDLMAGYSGLIPAAPAQTIAAPTVVPSLQGSPAAAPSIAVTPPTVAAPPTPIAAMLPGALELAGLARVLSPVPIELPPVAPVQVNVTPPATSASILSSLQSPSPEALEVLPAKQNVSLPPVTAPARTFVATNVPPRSHTALPRMPTSVAPTHPSPPGLPVRQGPLPSMTGTGEALRPSMSLSSPSSAPAVMTPPAAPIPYGPVSVVDGQSVADSSRAQSQESGSLIVRGDVFLDGHRVGRWLSDLLSREALRPPSGGSAFDPRLSPAWPGTPIPS